MGIVSYRESWVFGFLLASSFDLQLFTVMSSDDLKVKTHLAVKANSLRHRFLFLPASNNEIFALERMAIISLYCLQERWQLLQRTQAWTRGVGKREGGVQETEIHEEQQSTQKGCGM